MDLNATSGVGATATLLPAGIDHALVEADGPTAHGDRMGTPAPDEKVLWKGRPAFRLFARTAFHTLTLGVYFAVLVVIAMMMGNTNAAIVSAALGAALIAILYLLAWLSTRSTLYILTDTRLIMRIGMAIETRINLPLKQVAAANFRARGKGHGDIAFELTGERLLSTLLLWPHVRPFHYAMPQPMLRAVPEAAHVAQMIAEARAQYGAIERNLTEINEAAPASVQHAGQGAGAAMAGRIAPVMGRAGQGLEGAPA